MSSTTALQGIHDSALAVFIRTSPFGYPMLEVAHIAGIALLFGTLWLVDMRVLGLGRALPTLVLARFALVWTVAGFGLLALSGSLMFVSRINEFIANPVFKWKFGLIALAGMNAVIMHTRGGLHKADVTAKTQAVLSLLLWLSVMTAGRWIAYV
jgi:hypothetical protein